MGLTTSEVESLRLHLGYGNIGPYGAPYTPDTFLELFEGVVAPNLSTGAETTATDTIDAGTAAVVTPASMTGLVPYATVVVDTANEAEAVVIRSVTGSTFSATFQKAHAGTYPIAVMCGVARLRLLLWDADAAWRALTNLILSTQAGIKKVDEIEFFEGFGGLSGRRSHYQGIVAAIAALVQVPPKGADGCIGRLEAY